MLSCLTLLSKQYTVDTSFKKSTQPEAGIEPWKARMVQLAFRNFPLAKATRDPNSAGLLLFSNTQENNSRSGVQRLDDVRCNSS